MVHKQAHAYTNKTVSLTLSHTLLLSRYSLSPEEARFSCSGQINRSSGARKALPSTQAAQRIIPPLAGTLQRRQRGQIRDMLFQAMKSVARNPVRGFFHKFCRVGDAREDFMTYALPQATPRDPALMTMISASGSGKVAKGGSDRLADRATRLHDSFLRCCGVAGGVASLPGAASRPTPLTALTALTALGLLRESGATGLTPERLAEQRTPPHHHVCASGIVSWSPPGCEGCLVLSCPVLSCLVDG